MSRKLLAGTLLLSAVMLVAVFHWNRASPMYSRSVSEFLAHPVREQPVRILGRLVPGTLCRRDNPCEWRFSLTDRPLWLTDAGPDLPTPQLSVHYPQCLVPDTFREGLGVIITVEGELCKSCHRFEASTIFAMSHLKYEMNARGDASPPPLATGASTPLCTGS
ncbi:MAG TPA: cytochrome c maturation protein CcmE [Polyangiaceae bacterium]